MKYLPARRYKDPASTAIQVLARSGMPRMENGVAIDVEAILRDYCGFDVVHVPNLNPGGQPLLGLFVPAHSMVMVEANSIESRKRFSLAHELGHAELEHDFGPAASLFPSRDRDFFACTVNDERASSDERAVGARRRREIRANQFAATLLMPKDLVREVWQRHVGIEGAAEILAVSKEALGYRLSEIGLIERFAT